jgi:hypothetical protein
MSAAHLTISGPLRFAGALLLSVSLAACASGTGEGSPSTGLSTGSNEVSASSKPPASGTSPPDAAGTTDIPASALLQPSDMRGAKAEPVEEGRESHLRPLRPCGDSDPYPSDESRTAAVAVSYAPGSGGAGTVPDVFIEFVGRHASGGAADQFDEINEALRRCPGSLAEKKRRWTKLGTDIAGDESVLVRIDQKMSYGDEEPETVSDYAALARTGDMIVVVADIGWENLDGSEKMVRDLIGKAVQRAGTAG